MNKISSLCLLMTLGFFTPLLEAKPVESAASAQPSVRKVDLFFKDMTNASSEFKLGGLINPDSQIEFQVRSDELVSQAVLNLQFTPSPSLTPIDSQLKVYLNDELMGVVAIQANQLGQTNQIQVPIDPRYLINYNRLKVAFIGHYKSTCEDPNSNTIWVDISKSSTLSLTLQSLPLQNDLTRFPKPFFDSHDTRRLHLPMVFANAPNLSQQRTAAILASWFGSKAKWHGQSFPALFNQVPEGNAVVFATNDQKPSFLQNLANVNAPTVAMIDHPNSPYNKLLLIMGRNDNDLLTAVKGITQGQVLFRGQQVVVDKVEQLAPRKPYDAPNWIRTDQPTPLSQIQQYKEQLETKGIKPYPISLNFSLPPDLYLNHSKGIDLHLIYHYTKPSSSNLSRLNINLNDQFVRSTPLKSASQSTALQALFDLSDKLLLPTLEFQTNNKLTLDFDYSISINSLMDHCGSTTLANNHVNIDGNSTIDFSGLYHYITMPDLKSFVQAGFPFSRLADLSETQVLVKPNPQPEEVSALLNALGMIGSRTGYPALNMNLTDDWSQVKNKDLDLLIIGSIPQALRDPTTMNFLIQANQSWVKDPLRQEALPNQPPLPENTKPDSKTTVTSQGTLAAVIGMQSPFYSQRSIVALLADSPQAFVLLNNTLTDNTKTGSIYGTVSVIRESGTSNLRVGQLYHVGHVPWWNLAWYSLQTHPALLALVCIFVAAQLGVLIWITLNRRSRRRLMIDDQD